jgi:hypothetical protein
MPVTPGATPTEVNLGNTPSAQTGFRLGIWQNSDPYPDPNYPEKFVRDVSVELPNLGGVDARTTATETIALASEGKLVTLTNAGAIAVTLDSTVPNYFLCAVQVDGAGAATFTPSSGLINGAANASIAGGSNLGGWLFFDGTNWWMLTGGGGGFTNGQLSTTVAPPTGSKAFLQVPFDCVIVSWTMLGDVSGSAQITVKKSTYTAFPTTSSIVASAPPNLSSAQKNTSSTLTGWTTSLAKGDILEFNLDSIATIARVMLALAVTRSD